MEIFDFEQDCDLSGWQVVDDVVMGGRSNGGFYLNAEGHAVFEGVVSLENNGGFSSVRYRFEPKQVQGYRQIAIRLKGDGKRYQCRVKSGEFDRHSYVTYFQTTGNWETIEIPLPEMYPAFRGRRLNMPNYPSETMTEMAFLVGNKKAESFRLEIDRIDLE